MRGACVRALAALVWLWPACNFDSAFARYCQNNPHCRFDAGGPETGRETGDSAPEIPPDVLPDAEPEVVADADVGGGGAPSLQPPSSCRMAADCPGPNQVCDQGARICLTTCRSSADCPPGNDTCVGGWRGVGVCMCTSLQACDAAASGFRCNPADKVCEPSCYVPNDCWAFNPPRVCDSYSGFCRPPCDSNYECPTADLPHCDQGSGLCTGCIDATDCSDRMDGFTECGTTGSCMPPSSTP